MNRPLVVEGVSKSVNLPDGSELAILRHVDFNVAAGGIVSIMGKSGSGKSTLLSLMGLLSRPTGGRVVINGEDAGGLSDAQRARLRNEAIGYIFQNYSLVPTWTTIANCQMPHLYGRRLSRSESSATAKAALDKVGLSSKVDLYPRQLSGGEQQRVAIARALVRQPSLILADEPTGALDETTAEVVLELLIDTVASTGTAMVLVTHDSVVASRAQTHYELTGGRLAERAS